MGGVSLDDLGPFDGYSCPWCPVVVMVVDCQDAARNVMESHLDGHFAQPIGRPVVPHPRSGNANAVGAA